MLSSAWSHSPSEVARLISDAWVADAENDILSLSVLRFAPSWPSDLQATALTIAARSQLEPLRIDFWLDSIAAVDQRFAIDLLLAFLEKARLDASAEATELQAKAALERPQEGDPPVEWYLKNNVGRPIEALLKGEGNWPTANSLAELQPEKFALALATWFAAVCNDLAAVLGDNSPPLGFPLKYQFRLGSSDYERQLSNSESLLDALLTAIRALGQNHPDSLLRFAAEVSSAETAPVQRLVAMALTLIPEAAASTAHQFLLSDPRRFHLGNSADPTSTTQLLVSACAPHWTPEQLEGYIAAVNAYSPTKPSGFIPSGGARSWQRVIRRTRVNLLRALPSHLRLGVTDKDVLAPTNPASTRRDGPTGGFIGSPMSRQQMTRASVSAIVNAFKKVPDTAGWDHPRHHMLGGNVQLSREFASLALKHSERVLEVLAHLEPSFGQRAAGYALAELAKSADPDAVQASLCSLLDRGFCDGEFRGSVASTVNALANREVRVTEHVLEVMRSWVPSQHPAGDSIMEERRAGGDEAESFLLSEDGEHLRIAQGDYLILAAIVDARLASKEPDKAVAVLMDYLSASKDGATWQSMCPQLARLLDGGIEGSVELVQGVLEIEALDGTAAAAALHVQAAQHGAHDAVVANLPRWGQSSKPLTRQGFGEVAALIAIVRPEAAYAAEWFSRIVERDEATTERAGAAASAAHIAWHHREHQTRATDALLRLLQRNEAAVWRRVFRLFAHVESLKGMPEAGRLIEEMAARYEHAPLTNERQFVERLPELISAHSGAVAHIAEALVTRLADKLNDPTSLLASSGDMLVDLSITLHRTVGTQAVGLRIFEHLIEMDATQAREALDELDHRIRRSNWPSAPRLPRRGPVARKRVLRAA